MNSVRNLNKFSFNGTFVPAASTSFIHDGVTMTEYENEPFIVGDYNHKQVEFMHLSHEKWYTANPISFGIQRIFGYAAVSRPGKVFLLGGSLHFKDNVDDKIIDQMTMSQIILYQNDQWKPLGELKHARINFMTITYGTDVMIIAGKTYEQNVLGTISDLSAEIELFPLIDAHKPGQENDNLITDSTNMVLPNSMLFNGISIILNDTSTCQETQIGMNIKILNTPLI